MRPFALLLSFLAAAVLSLPMPLAAAGDAKKKSVKAAKKSKKARKPKEHNASGGATAAPLPATDLGYEAERDEARIRRRNAERMELSE
jgi:hypothetical protein